MQPPGTDIERAERLREVFQGLYEINKRIPIIVEGRRDVLALRKIGLVGDIIALHGGKRFYEFCEDIAERFHRVILLMDWDEKGDTIHRNVAEHLKGMWEEFSAFREVIRLLCQKDIKDIEGIPVLLERLAGADVTVGEPEEGEGFKGDI
ncbi:MAG: toprim domain-containing protein [Alphaproteobacteria bacterium]|uniref:Toprim domain-containing protein n=1 Tax=Candidatus Nitrobium versatile TaxID=2884831 RepID=A0A953LYS4_9BACT|nr:toprim domain-containing protein [Candidatus Nitrobium versatile]